MSLVNITERKIHGRNLGEETVRLLMILVNIVERKIHGRHLGEETVAAIHGRLRPCQSEKTIATLGEVQQCTSRLHLNLMVASTNKNRQSKRLAGLPSPQTGGNPINRQQIPPQLTWI